MWRTVFWWGRAGLTKDICYQCPYSRGCRFRIIDTYALWWKITLITNHFMKTIYPDIPSYNWGQLPSDKEICETLMHEIKKWLPEAGSKIWHWHPVWFLEGNPIVGYSKLKDSVRLMFWSGQSFEEAGLQNEWSFKAAEKRYTDISQINKEELARWIGKSRIIQWDYKNIVKRKWKLEPLNINI